MTREQFILQLDWQKAVLAQLNAIRDALIARLDVEFEGAPVRRAKESGDYADELRGDWEVAADEWERKTNEETK